MKIKIFEILKAALISGLIFSFIFVCLQMTNLQNLWASYQGNGFSCDSSLEFELKNILGMFLTIFASWVVLFLIVIYFINYLKLNPILATYIQEFLVLLMLSVLVIYEEKQSHIFCGLFVVKTIIGTAIGVFSARGYLQRKLCGKLHV